MLKRKIEEFEVEKEQLKAKVVDYQTKLASKSIYKPVTKTGQNKVKINKYLIFIFIFTKILKKIIYFLLID